MLDKIHKQEPLPAIAKAQLAETNDALQKTRFVSLDSVTELVLPHAR